MALQIMKAWELTVLRISLEVRDRQSVVRTELIAYPSGTEQVFWSRTDSPHLFGILDGPGPPREVRLPRTFASEVSRQVRDDIDTNKPLWLRLVPPYGALGAVPWEELSSAVGVPLIRVPDRMPVPAVRPGAWSIAVVACVVENEAALSTYITDLARSVGAAFERAHIHIFTDQSTYLELTSELKSLGDVESITTLHDPGRPNADRRQSAPWRDWVVQELGDEPVQALHLVLDGAFDNELAVVDIDVTPVAARPQKGSRGRSRIGLSPLDVRALADSVGASVVSFTSMATQTADVAARMVADDVGASRPGPTIFSSWSQTSLAALVDAHAYVAGVGGRVPQDASSFCYLQPEMLAVSISPSTINPGYAEVDYEGLADNHSSVAVNIESGDSPAWLSAASRLIDSRRADLMRAAVSSDNFMSSDSAVGSSTALSNIQDFLSRYAGDL